MSYRLGLRALAILAVVAASTAVLVVPELAGEHANGSGPLLLPVLTLGHG